MHIEKFILASASPRRVELLRELGIRFEVMPANVQEWEAAEADAEALVKYNAVLKADYISKLNPNALVLGVDTTVCAGTVVLNKPKTIPEGFDMLRKLSGTVHTVYTAFCLKVLNLQIEVVRIAASHVRMKAFSEETTWQYLKLVNTLDRAGGYSILDHSDLIVDSFEGYLSTIVGLPVEALKQTLIHFNLWNVDRIVNSEVDRSMKPDV
jgi:septum formation protein